MLNVGFGCIFLSQVLFVIAQPDVYKSSNSDCYIVFGEAKVCAISLWPLKACPILTLIT